MFRCNLDRCQGCVYLYGAVVYRRLGMEQSLQMWPGRLPVMRMVAVVVSVISICGEVSAQPWEEYVNTDDGFRVNFPGEPTVANVMWESQLGYDLTGRQYTAERGPERYSVTVIDYSGLEAQGIERSESCPPGNAQCRAAAGAILGPGYWRHDERGALVYATFRLLQRDAILTGLVWEWQDRVEGHLIQLTNTADQSRTFAFVGMHERKLYILEGTVPMGYPEPALFQQSLGWVDSVGNSIRYQGVYSNSFHGMGVYEVPLRVGQVR